MRPHRAEGVREAPDPLTTTPLSAHNPRVQRLRRLAHNRRDRADERAFVIEGPTLLADALDARLPLEAIFVEPGAADALIDAAVSAGVACFHLVSGTLARAVSTATPQPAAAIAPWCDVPLDAVLDADLLLVLAGVTDPGNAGTLLRTAEAAGVGGVLFCDGSVDPFNPKSVRASAGSVFHVPVVSGGDPVAVLDRLGGAGRRRLGTVARGGDPYDRTDLTGPVAIVLGSEAHGLPAGVAPLLDGLLTVPMEGRADSLNVGVSGSVICFEARRQRRELGR